MKDLPEKIGSQMAKKDFLTATRGLTCSLELLKGTLKDVEALTEVKAELEGCRFSRTLNFNLEQGLSYNYVLVIGAKGPLIWRMW